MSDDAEDEREVELSTLAAIYPEIRLDTQDQFTISIQLPVKPTFKVPIYFPDPSDGLPEQGAVLPTEPNGEKDIHYIEHLPPLDLRITLPFGYPTKLPPVVEVSTSPLWLSQSVLDRLRADSERLWEELGHDQTVYAYIDQVQQDAENAFGVLQENEYLDIPLEYKIGILDFDIEARKAAFNKETFYCGICLDPKKGYSCHRMLDCDHVFCIQCLQDFYTDAITGGDLASVRCLEPGCAKKREEALSTGRRRKPKTNISPSELLQIPLEQTLVRRYVTLKHKAGLESDKNTVYCPRKWCQGAARSKKHRKPVEFENVEDEDEEEDAESNKPVMARGDLLCICEDCSFAFCSRCFQGWHGEVFSCTPRRDTGELNEEDKASIEYLKLHTTPCPTCAAPAQKTHGCNHMICFRCNSHFCYLCSSWLEPGNPYKHFNVETTGCYMRLWELENGDGDNVDYGFAGGLRDNMLDPEELVIPDEQMEQAAEADIPPAFVPLAVPFAREGPLVLRIGQLPQRPVPPAAPPAPRAPLRGRRRRGLGGGGGLPVGQRRVGIDPVEAAGLPLQRADIEELDARQQAWVQRFVEMALNDEEHLMEDD